MVAKVLWCSLRELKKDFKATPTDEKDEHNFHKREGLSLI